MSASHTTASGRGEDKQYDLIKGPVPQARVGNPKITFRSNIDDLLAGPTDPSNMATRACLIAPLKPAERGSR